MPKIILSEIEKIIENKEIYHFKFNTNQLTKHKIWEDDFFRKMFEELNSKVNHCLYWFSVNDEKTGNLLKELLDNQRDVLKSNGRTIPAINKNVDSNILYVGVRKGGFRKYTIKNRKRVPAPLSSIAGRIIQHLGYYDVGTTQGLQLNYWVNNIEIDVTLNIIEYPNLQDEFLYIIEKLYAIKLRPVFGKH